MAKKCNSCGFQQNPDNSNYCGKCGKRLGYSTYRLYNASDQTPVYNWTLKEYKKYENQVKSSWILNFSEKITALKDKYESSLDAIGWTALCFVFVAFFGWLGAKSCSSDNKIARIEINGKYGIGYNEDKMFVPATYDSISAYATGNQWIIYDKNTETSGLAYVTDSILNVLEPSKTKAIQIERNANGLATLQVKDSATTSDVWRVARKGIYENTTTYKRIVHPGVIWGKDACLVATKTDGGMQMLGPDGMPINGKTYFNIVIDPDSMIRAIDYDKTDAKHKKFGATTIHDYTGRQTSDKEFYGVNAFSDGVAWACLTAHDAKVYSHSLIDKNGNVLFKNKPNAVRCIGFGDGIGWYSKSYNSNNFTAVDKSGKDLFQIEAQSVYPFTMGLGPVYKGTSYSNQKLGFVDKTGKTVIPFKYKSKYSNPHFGPDSLMVGISLNGVEGKLHRNGTFIPDK